jgi:hypothetical protein
MTMKKWILCLLLTQSFPGASFAQEKNEPKAIMDGVYDSFIKVVPYVYSDEKRLEILRTDPGQKERLLKNLTDISIYFKNARHIEYFQRPGFRPSLESINYHLEDTINAVKGNNYIFAQKRLKALTALCISCHSQLSEKGSENTFGNAIKKVKRENFESDFAYGNYLFLVRRFSESERYYDLAIEQSLKDGSEGELYPSLRRLISINTKINFDPKNAELMTQKYLDKPQLPPLARNTLASWNKEIKKFKTFNPKKIKSVDSFIKKYLVPLEAKKSQTAEGENDMTLLIASGVLSKHLNDFPKSKLAPEILYWLSITERRLSNTYFFSLSDLYLKDCVKLYAKSKYAKKCYDEYAENIEFGYSGSGGTDIPAEEKRELDRLKGYLK